MSVYDIDSFLSDKEEREYSWRWQKESPVWNAQPGAAHKALVKLEKAGMLTLLATQNFDALHEKAGNSPDVIVNLHGTIGTSHCMKWPSKTTPPTSWPAWTKSLTRIATARFPIVAVCPATA